MSQAEKVRDLLAVAEQRLQAMALARLDAEVLLANCMQSDRASLYAHPEREVSAQVAADFRLLLSRRLQHYPVAYLTGTREFWSLELEVDSNTLIPRPESECLVETALQYIPQGRQVDILDLGTGSGAIALALARERPLGRVLAVDISEDALAVSCSNARRHRIGNVSFLQSDWFSALTGRLFDVILSNPPYVDSNDSGFCSGELSHEPRLALDGGHRGMQVITRLIPAATQHLTSGGLLVIEHGDRQTQAVHRLFVACHYRDIRCKQDYAGRDRLSFAHWP